MGLEIEIESALTLHWQLNRGGKGDGKSELEGREGGGLVKWVWGRTFEQVCEDGLSKWSAKLWLVSDGTAIRACFVWQNVVDQPVQLQVAGSRLFWVAHLEVQLVFGIEPQIAIVAQT